MRRAFLVVALLLGALVAQSGHGGGAAAHHGSQTYCDKWNQKIHQDAQIDLVGDQLKWVMNQRICVWDTFTAHWKLTTVRTCTDFKARINNPPFTMTAYEKSHIVSYAGC
jgi:hypothetical protein